MRARTGTFVLVAALATAVAGCAGVSFPGSFAPARTSAGARSPNSPIEHVVIVVQENRTFNDFFATFPGADGTTTGKVAANPNCTPPIEAGTIALKKAPLRVPHDINHSYTGFNIARDDGKLDGFDKVKYGNKTIPECTFPYRYTDPSQIRPYWDMAKQYTLAEHMFTTHGSDSFAAHQDLIRGGTVVETRKAMIDFPTCGNCHWGCDAPAGTYTHLITKDDQYLEEHGPFPCSNKFEAKYPTLRDLLDAKGVSWKYYTPPFKTANGKLLSAFDVIAPVRYGSEWKTNVISPQTQILDDVSNGALAAVSWVVPDQPDSDHPGDLQDDGPSWVASIVNAIGKSSYWSSTAIVVVWDDWGGFYDNIPPPRRDYGGLGFRVPAIIVSPYAKPRHIAKANYEFGSILRYIEENWGLGVGALGTSDRRAASIRGCFNYAQHPIEFKRIRSRHSPAYFVQRKPSYVPPDTDM